MFIRRQFFFLDNGDWGMDAESLKRRTKDVAKEVIGIIDGLPKNSTSEILGKQIIRSAASTAANYRAACRAKSRADFIYKSGIVEEEADETLFWMELLTECGKVSRDRIASK